MLARARGVKRKLTGFAEEERRLYRHEAARVKHLSEIYSMQSFDDVKYETWSRTRLQRMLVDYLLRQGYGESARMLARDGRIEELVDVETFEQMARISSSLRNGSVMEALAWCTAGDTKKELRKMDVSYICSCLFNSRNYKTKPGTVKSGVYAPLSTIYRARETIHTSQTRRGNQACSKVATTIPAKPRRRGATSLRSACRPSTSSCQVPGLRSSILSPEMAGSGRLVHRDAQPAPLAAVHSESAHGP